MGTQPVGQSKSPQEVNAIFSRVAQYGKEMMHSLEQAQKAAYTSQKAWEVSMRHKREQDREENRAESNNRKVKNSITSGFEIENRHINSVI